MASIHKRGGVWYSDIRIGGKRIHRALSSDKRIAEERLAELVRQRQARRHGHALRDPAWASFKESFLEKQKSGNRTTYNLYAATFTAAERFRPVLSLSGLTPQYLQDFYTHQKKIGRGLYMRNRMLQNLKAILNYAARVGHIEKLEWSAIKMDKEPRGRLLWYSVEDFKKVLAVTHGRWKTLAMLCGRAGLRPGEAYHLEWSDVDFERGRLHIAPKEGWSPKDYERRWVPMSKDLREYLQKIERTGDPVIGKDRPKEWSLPIYWKKLMKRAGVPGTMYTLRHTFGAQMASAGVSIYILKDLLGHATVKTTQIYAHLSPESKAAAIDNLPPL